MDNTVLKKKLSTFRSKEGYLVGVSADVLQELLRAWEAWTGKSKDFYRSIGVSQKQIAMPGDGYVTPTDMETIFMGRINAVYGKHETVAPSGTRGSVGYILP